MSNRINKFESSLRQDKDYYIEQNFIKKANTPNHAIILYPRYIVPFIFVHF